MNTPPKDTDGPPPIDARRHDLDALRGFAMLLGIALHAVVAYVPANTADNPSPSAILFALFMSATHGFRMPLFILLSGYFTAMLWRKRGLRSLLIHRFKRVFVPCLLAVLAIMPFVIGISIAAQKAEASKSSLWKAASDGNLERIQFHLEKGANIDAQKPKTGITPLILAASNGRGEAVSYLLEQDAQVDLQAKDSSSPLHAAALYGRAEIARLLIEQGADPHIRRNDGITPYNLTQLSWKATQRIAKWSKVEVDQVEVQAGRLEIAAMLGEQTDTAFTPLERYRGLTRGPLFAFPIFGHMWFLWYLCWLIGLFAICVVIARRLRIKQLPNWMLLSRKRYLWLIPLAVVPQSLMSNPTSFGPGTSSGLLPMPHILLYYGIFFAFGALYYQRKPNDRKVGRSWKASLPFALLFLFPTGFAIGLGNAATGFDPNAVHLTNLVISVSYTWLMIFGLIGLFRGALDRSIPWVRYLSDSSYWLYLAHLPLVFYMQFLMRDWSVSPFLKFGFICLIATTLLLLSYEYLVRYRWLGKLLNGPRKRRTPMLQSD
ncbi:MAG: acyltransferase family protein [Verrucomicrobiota bacterium]